MILRKVPVARANRTLNAAAACSVEITSAVPANVTVPARPAAATAYATAFQQPMAHARPPIAANRQNAAS
jgi:hypothetical protein